MLPRALRHKNAREECLQFMYSKSVPSFINELKALGKLVEFEVEVGPEAWLPTASIAIGQLALSLCAILLGV